jgi:hypothetical protein
VKRSSGTDDTTVHDARRWVSDRISSRAAGRYHVVAVPPLDLGAMLTATGRDPWRCKKRDHVIVADLS